MTSGEAALLAADVTAGKKNIRKQRMNEIAAGIIYEVSAGSALLVLSNIKRPLSIIYTAVVCHINSTLVIPPTGLG